MADEFPNRAGYHLALIDIGKSDEEADRLTAEKWKTLQREVLAKDEADYPSPEEYVRAMATVELPGPVIDERIRAAKERLDQARQAQRAARLERARRELERDREDDRIDDAVDAWLQRYALDDSYDDLLDGQAADAARERVRQRYPADRYGRMETDPRFGLLTGEVGS